MLTRKNLSRRSFIGKSAMGAAGIIAAPVVLRASNPSDVIGVALVGAGIRGQQVLGDILGVPKMQVRAVCDVFNSRLAWAAENCGNPKVRTYVDYRGLLDSADIDAVVFETPDHQHAQQTIDAVNAGKDVYCEKCMTHILEEAKQVIKTIKDTGRVYQLGHQLRSFPVYMRAKEIYESGALGPVTYVTAWHHRNSTTDHPWRYHLDEKGNPPPDATPENIRWDLFLMNAPSKPFDVFRFLNWRVYRDYGEGIAGDLQSHAFDSINMIMDTGIPDSCMASGGIYYWDDGREIPDTWTAIFEYPKRNLQVAYNCTLANGREGWGIEFRGKEASMFVTANTVEVFAESVSPCYENWIKEGRERNRRFDTDETPVYSFDGDSGLATASHMENFAGCIRSRKPTRCNEDEGFEESVTAFMSIESYEQKKRITWDAVRREIL